MKKKLVKVLNAGRLGYITGLKLQQLVQKNVRNTWLEDTLIVVEHDPVYTVGIREKIYTVEEEERLRRLGAEFYRTKRGGLITFHGPGQMVVYPIINLKNFEPSVRWYVCHLEKTIIELCAMMNLTANTSPHTGVWINDSKVCAIGIHVSRYLTSHGLALNCDTQLKWFEEIVPCGIEGKTATSLSQQLERDVTVKEVLPSFKMAFGKLFGCEVDDHDRTLVADLVESARQMDESELEWLRAKR